MVLLSLARQIIDQMASVNSSSMIDDDLSDWVIVDAEMISDSFICCVCSDLLYKPVVLGCGHVSCFWCVLKSMNRFGESRCPSCGNPYHHFPTICKMLHSLLLNMYPLAYKRRERQILEEERKMGYFSPELDGKVLDKDDVSGTSHDAKADSEGSAAIRENSMLATDDDRTCDVVSRTNVLCPACKELLFRPAVLNCGHVYCESCIVVPEDGAITCSVCQSPHPSQAPNFCLEFNNFLEEKFPEEYAVQRKKVEHKHLPPKNPSTCSSSKNSANKDVFKSFANGEDFIPWWNEHRSKVHIGVGCDYCGMYPIVGDRYICEDCVELIGFDLCGDCYNSRSKQPGRFNQQHTPDHRLELVVQPDFLYDITLRLMGGQGVDSSGTPILAVTAGEDSQDSSIPIESANAPLLVPGDDN